MLGLLALPREILHRIFSFADQKSRKELRLASGLLGEIGQTWVFQTARISPVKKNWRRFQEILDHPDLAASITKIYLDTVTPEDDNRYYTEDNESKEGEEGTEQGDEGEEYHDQEMALPRHFWRHVNRLREFPRLQSVVLRFHPECDGEDDSWHDVVQDIPFRSAVMRKSMAVLAALPRRPQELAIQDLQNINPKDPVVVANLTKLLGGIKSLRLNIANQLDEGNGENDVEREAVHEFFPSLSLFWLTPAAANLQHLTIYSSIYFGFYPKFDLRGVHFPQLKTLALGNHTFVHDSQLDWILSHGVTLEELYLDDCPILFEVAIYDKNRTLLDPSDLKSHPRLTGKSHASYGTRWHDYFQAFKERLPHLQHFRFGHCPHWWVDDTTPFEKETTIDIGFHENYMVFCDGYGPSQYMGNMIYDEDGDGEPLEPSEEDKTALRELLAKLGQL
ncbi:hypothetical protein BDW59DRAFT_55159 [Aspergillus cavernicola]|uniref:F-box domain-containing protein n=1 Tax=Aspergillus cavernicola TaxID=176166 RepID=A0ABR4IJ87_9EURO